MQRVFLVITSVLFVGLVGISIWLAGSPGEARAKRFDEARVQALNAITNAVTNYYVSNTKLPLSLAELDASNRQMYNQTLDLVDPQSGAAYEYRVVNTSTRQFELCAQFNVEKKTDSTVYYQPIQEIWDHTAGRDCFLRVAGIKN